MCWRISHYNPFFRYFGLEIPEVLKTRKFSKIGGFRAIPESQSCKYSQFERGFVMESKKTGKMTSKEVVKFFRDGCELVVVCSANKTLPGVLLFGAKSDYQRPSRIHWCGAKSDYRRLTYSSDSLIYRHNLSDPQSSSGSQRARLANEEYLLSKSRKRLTWVFARFRHAILGFPINLGLAQG